MSRAEIRAADADRERTVDRLRRAAAEGRLEPDELEWPILGWGSGLLCHGKAVAAR